jgi:hypothetical protein
VDAAGLIGLSVFGAFCVVFGLCMRPLWRRVRRARLRRREAMMLSTARARERFLWVNAFGSIALGALLFAVMDVELFHLLQRRARDELVASIDRECTSHTLVLKNIGNEARTVSVSDPLLLEFAGYFGERPERWMAHFTDETTRVLQPGERAYITFDAGGACDSPAHPSLRSSHCTLAFDLTMGLVHERVSCGIN